MTWYKYVLWNYTIYPHPRSPHLYIQMPFWHLYLDIDDLCKIDMSETEFPILNLNSVPNIHWKDWCWSWNSNTLATWCEELTRKRHWCWERLRAGGEGIRGLDGWVASQTQWTWVWVNSGRWWRTGMSGMLWFLGLQRVGHDWVTELILKYSPPIVFSIWKDDSSTPPLTQATTMVSSLPTFLPLHPHWLHHQVFLILSTLIKK